MFKLHVSLYYFLVCSNIKNIGLIVFQWKDCQVRKKILISGHLPSSGSGESLSIKTKVREQKEVENTISSAALKRLKFYFFGCGSVTCRFPFFYASAHLYQFLFPFSAPCLNLCENLSMYQSISRYSNQ